ncbi:unnamed protein product [Victoria cruziana]
MNGFDGHEDEELEMLLGEIPNATSAANLHVEEFGVSNASMSLVSAALTDKTMGKSFCSDSLGARYLASQPSKHSSPYISLSSVPAATCDSFPSFCNGLNLSSHSSINSPTKNNRKPHNEDKLVLANSPGRKEYPMQVESADEEDNRPIVESKLPDVRSLTSALSNLSFHSEVSTGAAIDSSVQYKCFSNSGLLMRGPFPEHMAREQSSFEEVVGVYPQSPNAATGIHFGSPAVETQGRMNVRGAMFPSILSAVPVDKFNGEVSREENSRFLRFNTHETEREKHNPRSCPVDEFASTLEEQSQSFPIYSGPVQFPSGVHSFQVHPSVPVSGVEFPASVYQQQYYFNLQSSTFMQPEQYGHINASVQQLNQCHMAWQHSDEESCRAAQQQYAYLQLQFQGMETVSQLHPNSNGPGQSLNRSSRQPYCEVPISHVEHPCLASGLNGNVNMYPQRLSQPNQMIKNGNLSPCSAQSYCGRSEKCLFGHNGQNRTTGSGFICLSNSSPEEDLQGIKVLEKEVKQSFPERMLTRSHGVNELRNLKTISYLPNEITVSHANSNGRPLQEVHSHHHHSVPNAGSFIPDGHNSAGSSPDKSERLTPRSRQHLKCASLDEIEGRIYDFAKDQHGCRFLQEKFVEGKADDVKKIFVEIIDHIVGLMTDPFGNYLVQKLLDVCNENQRIQILHAITRNSGILMNICLNMHGTRAVQKVIETLKTSEQITMVVSSLRDGAVTLIKDLNGNHVVQRCLQCLDNKHNEFLFDAAAAHCVEIATHRHGCCVLQKCLYHSEGEQRQQLVSEVVANALILAQDPFGNYVVQYVIELGLSWATTHVVDQLEGHFANLSTQKYSSNVVEKCLKLAEEEKRALIIRELIDDPRLGQLLQDPFANYVVQSALANSKGAVHSAFVDAIKPHLPALRSNPYGKRILSCTNLKNYHVKCNNMEDKNFQLGLQNAVCLHQSNNVMTRR